MRLLGAPLWIVVAISPFACGQQVPIDPTSTHIFPAGGQRGTVVGARVGTELLPPHTALRIWGAGIQAPPQLGEPANPKYEASPRRDPRETPNSYPREWQSSVKIAADAPLGAALWRLSSARGGTGARPFIVGELPEIVESEPNSAPEKAQRVSLPLTINGQIAGERDTDYFQFTAEAGEVVSVEVAATRLGSPLEAAVEIHDSRGRSVRAQKLRGQGDPVLVFHVPASGEYRVFIANLGFRGGPHYVYRLTLNKLPFVAFAFPSVVTTGQSSEIETFRAFGTGELRQERETVLASAASGLVRLRAETPAANNIVLEATAATHVVEREPNEVSSQATELAPDIVASGQLASALDEDWYRFSAKKDQLFAIDCKPCPARSPALPVVSVIDEGGSTLAVTKSAESVDRNGALDWRAPADGTYHLRVADVQQGAAGGLEFIYCLSLRNGRPDFSLASKVDFINVEQGARSELEVTVTRRGGFDSAIDLAVEGLSDGVRIEPQAIAANQSTAKIAFKADAQARPTATTLKVTGSATIDGQKCTRTLTATHLGHNADQIGLGSSSVDHLQLTVAHKPVFKLYCSEAYQYAHRGTVYPYQMEIERLDGFDGPIHLEVADRQIKDLDGIEVREMTVQPGQTSFMLPLYLPETMHINIQAHSNVYAQGHVAFVDKWGQQQSHLVVSTMRCMVRTLPPVAKLQAVDRLLSVRLASTVNCRLELIRTSNFSGPMKIELVSTDRSTACAAEPVTLGAGESAVAVPVRVNSDVARPRDALLTFRATGSMSGNVQVVSEATVGLKFE
jgi:hypothetical protein